jgi:DNA-binding NarL/FixJ family response regulator
VQAGKPIGGAGIDHTRRALAYARSDGASGAAHVLVTGDALPNRHRNAFGGLTFRAYWLETDNPAGLIGITLSHKEPLPVAVMRRMRDLSLTRRQALVCLLLAMGFSHSRIAQELGISKHTVIAHSRWIYDKLDVHNRTDLSPDCCQERLMDPDLARCKRVFARLITYDNVST